MLPPGDREFVLLVDGAFEDSARRSGSHLICHPGCTPCCHGVFAISSLDAERLREGLAYLTSSDPLRAQVLRRRIKAAQDALGPQYPGDPASGHLFTDEASEELFEAFANDEPCPVLNPDGGTCDLYEYRPITCRVFGPPVRSQDGVGVCELCFRGATRVEISAAELHLPDAEIESTLTAVTGDWSTIVAFAFERACVSQPGREFAAHPESHPAADLA